MFFEPSDYISDPNLNISGPAWSGLIIIFGAITVFAFLWMLYNISTNIFIKDKNNTVKPKTLWSSIYLFIISGAIFSIGCYGHYAPETNYHTFNQH